MVQALKDRQVVLIISGGIAAYKSLDLIRRLRDAGALVRPVLTESATHLVTPLSVSALCETPVATDLFSLTSEHEMSHIRVAQESDLIIVAPATANLIAKMRAGIADDLASTILLAAKAPILLAPAMNEYMWRHPATVDNLRMLVARGVTTVGPNSGSLACGDVGEGRMAEVHEILSATITMVVGSDALEGRCALVTSGPTHEPIDPVRFIANRSSGRQGHAIAAALARAGAETTLISGPTELEPPHGVRLILVETAREMLAACREALPADIAVCAAAVADWRIDREAGQKIKKGPDGPPSLQLTENPDILRTLSELGAERPALVIGFAAETEDVENNAKQKRIRKGCDWIVANDVSPGTGTFGGAENTVQLITEDGVEQWVTMSKVEVAEQLVRRIIEVVTGKS